MNTILITGASSGIGKATVLFFYKKGWNVIATMREIPLNHGLPVSDRLHIETLDITNPENVSDVIKSVINKHKTIDALVNNAGYGVLGPLELISHNSLTSQFMTNVVGTMDMTKAVIPFMREQKRGVIVNVSSMMGRISFPYFSPYAASKWALEGFSETLQIELRPFGIKVKLVEPGTIKTHFFDNADAASLETSIYTQWPSVWKNVYTRGENGTDPEKAAQVIYNAVISSSQKMRYSVDPISKLLPFLRAISPLRLFQYILSKTVK